MNTPDPLIDMVNVADLKADPKNPRTISKPEFEALTRSIEAFGFVQPVVANKRNMVIIGGHQRVEAAKILKLKSVPVVWVDLDASQQTTLNLALNKIAGEFDTDQLAELILTLDDDLLSLTGFSDEDLVGLSADPFDDEDEPKPDKPKERKYTLEELRTLAKGIYPAQADVILDFLEAVQRASA